jgi:hypothetical protein
MSFGHTAEPLTPELINVNKRAKAANKIQAGSFVRPSYAELEVLAVGTSVKVGVPLPEHSAEWFWVEIVSKHGGGFIATVNNKLIGADKDHLQRGDRICIKRDHILTIYDARVVAAKVKQEKRLRKAAARKQGVDTDDEDDFNIRIVHKDCMGRLHVPTQKAS